MIDEEKAVGWERIKKKGFVILYSQVSNRLNWNWPKQKMAHDFQ
jgi:hypothetical protein